MELENICKSFLIDGKITDLETITNGIINTSFKITVAGGGEYILQKINKTVFRQPDKIMANICGVTDFIRRKIENEGGDPSRRVLNYRTAADGKNYVVDAQGNYWRAYTYIAESVVYNEAEDENVIEQVGKAFGEFQMYLSDYDAAALFEAIPDFHNTAKRYAAFYGAVKNDAAGRAESVAEEIAAVKGHEKLATKLSLMAASGELPLRVTHNDTKCNNVVFDADGKTALAVIDLDTVMPGLVAYDFGDAARFICSNAAEDESDLSKVTFNLDKFNALAKGFCGAVGGTLTEKEAATLSLGAYAMAAELALRFLTDYLNGDVYFKTYREGHNLDRARCQLRLADDILRKLSEMDKIVKSYI